MIRAVFRAASSQQVVLTSDGIYSSLKGAGSYGSPLKDSPESQAFLKAAAITIIKRQ